MSWRAQGMKPWLLQRLTAVYMGLYVVVILLRLPNLPAGSYAAWHGWVTSPMVATTTALFFLCLLLHAWIGLRDVAIDYLHEWKLRVGVLVVVGFGLVAMGIWVLRVLFG